MNCNMSSLVVKWPQASGINMSKTNKKHRGCASADGDWRQLLKQIVNKMSRASIRLYSNISEHRLQPSTFGQEDKTSRSRVPYLRDTTWSAHFGRETINKILSEIAASSVAVFSFHMKIATVTRTTRLSSSNCTAFRSFHPPSPAWPHPPPSLLSTPPCLSSHRAT